MATFLKDFLIIRHEPPGTGIEGCGKMHGIETTDTGYMFQ